MNEQISRQLAQAPTAQGEPITKPLATLHRDGYWTHPAGKEPFDRFSQKCSIDVFATPPDSAAEIARLTKDRDDWVHESLLQIQQQQATIAQQAEEIARLKDCRSIEAMQLESQRCTIEQQAERIKEAERACEIMEQGLLAAGQEFDKQLSAATASLASKDAQLKIATDAIDDFLVRNDPSEFGCACEPEGYVCGPCSTHERQRVLYEALAAIEAHKKAQP